MKERWWFGADAQKALGARSELSVAGWMQAAAFGEDLATDRDSAAVRLDTENGTLLVKWRAVPPEQRWRWWLRASRERCEARGACAAVVCRIDAPGPLAVGERRDALGRLFASVLVRPFVEGVTVERWPRPIHAPQVQPVIAGTLRMWHDVGYRHGDCWPKNLLVVSDGTAVIPIGAPRAIVGPAGPALDDRRIDDLARFAAGMRIRWPDVDPLGFLADYAKVGAEIRGDLERQGLLPLRELPHERLVARVRARMDRVLAKRAEDERTRPLREPDGPPAPVPLPVDPRPVRREGLRFL